MSSAGIRYICAILATEDLTEWTRRGKVSHLLTEGEEPLYEFVRGYVEKHGQLPPVSHIPEGTVPVLPEVEGAAGHYYEALWGRHVQFRLGQGAEKATEAVEASDHDGAVRAFEEAAATLRIEDVNSGLFDLTADGDVIWDYYQQRLKGDAEGYVRLGWPTVDRMGGLGPGDVGSLVGRPATGKSYLMCWTSNFAWQEDGHRPLFVTQEMDRMAIEIRLAAMRANVPDGPIRAGDRMPQAHLDALDDAVHTLHHEDQKYWIMDGQMGSTVRDVHMAALGIGANVIYIDGAYLLQYEGARTLYDRVAYNMDLIKGMARALGVPVICSWQFNREAAKKMKKRGGDTRPDLEDIGYSDLIGQHSSVVLGLLQDEAVENLLEQRVSIMKGRNGETGSFMIRRDFMRMTFEEVQDQPVDEMEYVD